MTDGFVYGRAVLPIVTNIEGREPPISELARSRAFRLLCRYTSLIYIERQHLILSGFIDGFRGEAMRTADPYTQRWFAGVLAELYGFKASYETGIDLLRQGNPAGYRWIAQGAAASEYLGSRAVNEDFYHSEVSEWTAESPKPVGLVAWGRRAFTMGRYTLMTLRAEWTYERFQEFRLAEPEPAFPANLPWPEGAQAHGLHGAISFGSGPRSERLLQLRAAAESLGARVGRSALPRLRRVAGRARVLERRNRAAE